MRRQEVAQYFSAKFMSVTPGYRRPPDPMTSGYCIYFQSRSKCNMGSKTLGYFDIVGLCTQQYHQIKTTKLPGSDTNTPSPNVYVIRSHPPPFFDLPQQHTCKTYVHVSYSQGEAPSSKSSTIDISSVRNLPTPACSSISFKFSPAWPQTLILLNGTSVALHGIVFYTLYESR